MEELSNLIETRDQDATATIKKEMEAMKELFRLLSVEVKGLTALQEEHKAATHKIAQDLQEASKAHAALQDSIQEDQDIQAATDAAIKDQLDSLQSQLEAALSAPTIEPAKDMNRCPSDTCAPEVSSNGESLQLNARGGSIVLETAECQATDLCDLAKNVKALLSKYGL